MITRTVSVLMVLLLQYYFYFVIPSAQILLVMQHLYIFRILFLESVSRVRSVPSGTVQFTDQYK